MYAIEFEADVINGTIKIPDKYRNLEAKHLKAIILLPDESTPLSRPTYDFSDLAGKLTWQGDALAEQRKLRDEWK
tara:strand:+ start:1596 stop:1820 length:225 start_codon:yes stop_codon:yes gene_type:complete